MSDGATGRTRSGSKEVAASSTHLRRGGEPDGRLRPPAHTRSGHRLGAAEPRESAPLDLRLLPPAIGAWVGAALAPALPGGALVLGVTGCCVGAAASAAVGWWQRVHRPGEPSSTAPVGGVWVAVTVALLCAAAGGTVAALHQTALTDGPLPALAERHAFVTAELTLTGDPRRAKPVPGRGPPSVVVTAEASWVRTAAGARTVVSNPVLVMAPPEQADRWLELLPSSRVEVRARLAPPLPDRGEQVAAVVRVTADGAPWLVAGPTLPQRLAGGLRAGLLKATDELPADARAMIPAIVVGDASRIPPDLWEAVRDTDMTHIIVVSGAHVSIVLAVLIGAPSTASRAERRGIAAWFGIPLRTTAVLGGALLLAFVVVCRPGPSVLRAAVCGAITLVAIATGRRRSLLPALAAAVLLLVLYDPALARSFGFVLSVLATGALLVVAPGWSLALQRRGLPVPVAEALAVTAAAQAVCAPVVVVFAARVSLVAVPCNLLASVAFAPATLLGCAALALAPVSMPLASGFGWLASWPARWIAEVARTGAALPGAQASWPDGWAGAALLAAVTVLVLLLVRIALRRVWLAAACVVLLLCAVLRPQPLDRFLTGWPPDGWRLVACDVGQGDALVLAVGEGSAVVVDVGQYPEAIDDCLRRLGVRRIPLVVLSHFHADHVAGLPGALRGRSVGAVQTSPLREPAGQAAFVDRVARAAKVPVTVARPGERRSVGPLSWQVLWPPESVAGLGANDASVTLLVRVQGLTLFLPGDLEPLAQQRLLADNPTLPTVDVLKVAHHGSAYQDPELQRRLSPRLALVSAGEDNGYGHPAPTTLRMLRAQGAQIVRTDTDGELAVVVRAGRVVPVRAAPRRGGPGRQRRQTPPASGRRPASSYFSRQKCGVWGRKRKNAHRGVSRGSRRGWAADVSLVPRLSSAEGTSSASASIRTTSRVSPTPTGAPRRAWTSCAVGVACFGHIRRSPS